MPQGFRPKIRYLSIGSLATDQRGSKVPTADDIYRVNPTDEEIADVLGQRLTAAVATLHPNGSIHQAYVIFLYENGKFYWETASSTRKIKNLKEDNRTSFLVDGTASTGTTLMVAGSGTARLITGDEGETINRRLRSKYITDEAIDKVNEVWGAFDDVCVEVTPDRFRSWTNKPFGQATIEAFGDNPPETIWRSD